jgi:hypothetical protein
MAKPKRKTLPKDFEALLAAGDLGALNAVFEICDLDARGGYSKQSALGFHSCPDELARFLVAAGADIEASDAYGKTPLLSRAGDWRANMAVLLELGADIHACDSGGNTPLHHAARIGHVANSATLLERGADAGACNAAGQMPLLLALTQCSNATIERVAAIAELLLPLAKPDAPSRPSLLGRIFGRPAPEVSPVTPEMRKTVDRIGREFEFHRAGFNPDSLEATDAALTRLYDLFGVEPVPRRAIHDGKAAIAATAAEWEDRHQELWQLLVPSSGAAATVQGEVIRISGRIHDELEGNGGINWDKDYAAMADALLRHLGTANALPEGELASARALIAEAKRKSGDPRDLCRLAVAWVALNSKPIALTHPGYAR